MKGKKQIFCGQFGKGSTMRSLEKLYEKCKPAMLKKFGRVLSYEEFIATLGYAHEKGMV